MLSDLENEIFDTYIKLEQLVASQKQNNSRDNIGIKVQLERIAAAKVRTTEYIICQNTDIPEDQIWKRAGLPTTNIETEITQHQLYAEVLQSKVYFGMQSLQGRLKMYAVGILEILTINALERDRLVKSVADDVYKQLYRFQLHEKITNTYTTTIWNQSHVVQRFTHDTLKQIIKLASA